MPVSYTHLDVYKRQLLTNKRYIGENHFKDIVMPDSIPAIVDKDLFEEVQQKIKKNSRAPARHKAEDDYLLTTKLFCGIDVYKRQGMEWFLMSLPLHRRNCISL